MPPTVRHRSSYGVDAVETHGVVESTPWHDHARLVLGIVDSGWCRIAFRDATVKVTAGQGFVIAPETAHRVVLDGMADHRALSVPPPAGKACPRSGLIVHPRWAVAFGAAFDELPADGRRACRDLVALAGATLGYIGAHGPEPRAVRSVRQRLAATDVARPTLEQLAATAGLSPWHLQRLYLRQTGLSPHDADQAIRLRQARTLVLAGMPLAVAAAVAGFSDQSHFNRVFKRLMWLPPGRWAAQVQRSRSSIG
ncbi:MAG: AraC family transcriptional regulator [Ancalomicrobiaceae bacterium]|nr:AraC family transcriptional regulator [Ancalomicrobiaceae bacterium]